MPKRTYKPSKRRRKKRMGYLSKSKTKSGSKILKRRRSKGRHQLTP